MASSLFSFQVLQQMLTRFLGNCLSDKLKIFVSVTQLYENRVGTEDVLKKHGICCGQTRRTAEMWIYQVQESGTVETTPTGNI